MLLRHSKKICFIDSALRWCSDIPIEKINDKTRDSCLEDCMDSFIDAHLYFLPLPRFARTYDSEESFKGIDQESTVYKAALLTTFSSEVLSLGNSTDFNTEIINNLFLQHYPSLDCLRDSRIDLSFQACLLCLMALDAKSLKQLNVKKMSVGERNTFTRLAFKEIKNDVGSFNTYIEMLKAVSDYLVLKQSKAQHDSIDSKIDSKISKEKKIVNNEISLEEHIDEVTGLAGPKMSELPPGSSNSFKHAEQVRPTESWSNVKHLKSRGILLAEIEALALSKVNNDADETHSSEELWNSLYVSNIVEENPDFAYKINLSWTTKILGHWTLL